MQERVERYLKKVVHSSNNKSLNSINETAEAEEEFLYFLRESDDIEREVGINKQRIWLWPSLRVDEEEGHCEFESRKWMHIDGCACFSLYQCDELFYLNRYLILC